MANYETTILLVDDERDVLDSLSLILNSGGHNDVMTCQDSRHVLTLMRDTPGIRLILLDLVMPYLHGQDLLCQLREKYPDVPVLVITALDDINMAVECMKAGAYDYLVKPVEKMRLLATVRHALQSLEKDRENRALKDQLFSPSPGAPQLFDAIVTRDPKMISIFKYIEAVGPSPEPVLVTGETGVGKELIARAIHAASGRRGNFVAVNIAGLDDNHFSDTLFGHRKGAFTGALAAREGLIAKAACGTLFLDEIGDMEPASQIKLLRLLQEGEYFPLGVDFPQKTDTRIIAATNIDIGSSTKAQHFRRDLFYRLQTHHISLPPLRDRKPDLPLLTEYFFDKAARRLGRKTPRFPRELIALLQCYHFPGNVRELEGMIFDAVSKATGPLVTLDSFREKIIAGPDTCDWPSEQLAIEDLFEQQETLPTLNQTREILIATAVKRAGGNQSLAARMLGIGQSALNKWLKAHAKNGD